MTSVEELRQQVEKDKEKSELEVARLKEKVLCAEVTLPRSMQKHLGINGFTMKANELPEFVEKEIENRDGNTVTFSIRFMLKTNKWIESLPEANI